MCTTSMFDKSLSAVPTRREKYERIKKKCRRNIQTNNPTDRYDNYDIINNELVDSTGLDESPDITPDGCPHIARKPTAAAS